MSAMINPLKFAESYIHRIEPGDYTEKIFALTPIVNIIFLEVKRLQLESSDPEKLKKFAGTVLLWLGPQAIIWAPGLSKLQTYLSFKWRTILFMSLPLYYLLSERHIEWVIDPS